MRNVNCTILSAADNLTTLGSQVDANQLVAASFHVVFGDTHAAGTFKLQVANDISNDRYQSVFTATHWVDVPNQSTSIVAGAQALLTIANMSYRWVRAVYTNTASYKQVQTVTTVADIAGSLNSTYFTLSSVNSLTSAEKDFYVWFDDGTGIDPAVLGATGIQIVYSDGDSANTLATAIRAGLNLLTDDFVATGATNSVIITNVNSGLVPAAADGSAPTGFTFANTTPGVNPTTVAVNMNALSL